LRKLSELPVHPFLFTAYAVFFLWSQNVAKVRTVDVVGPLLLVLAGTAALFVLAWLAFRSPWRAAIVTSALSFLFFSYGHVTGSVKSAGDVSKAPPHQTFWLVMWAVLAIAAVVLVALVKREGRRLAFVLNLVIGVLLVMSVASIGTQKVNARRVAAKAAAEADRARAAAPAASGARDALPRPIKVTGPKRDIYYLVLEDIGTPENMKENYGFDTTYFEDALRARGFYLPAKARGNYPKTPHAISATLNLDYLHLPKELSNWQVVYDSLKGSKAAKYLQARGYKYVLIGSQYFALHDDPSADVNFVYNPKAGPVQSEFAQVLYDSTVLSAIATRYRVGTLDERYQRYQRLLFQYQKMSTIPNDPAPTFMVGQVLGTHSPYVFTHDGHFISAQEADKYTSAQALAESFKYQAQRTLEFVDQLQAAYPKGKEPIIVLVSDEGPGPVGWNPNTKEHYDWTKAPQKSLDEKFRIFSAYYLPGLPGTTLYPTFSPVNIFRLVFAEYFGESFSLLPDRAYVFRNELEPYNFIDVTDRVKN
jgi:hypothetical protein